LKFEEDFVVFQAAGRVGTWLDGGGDVGFNARLFFQPRQ
jgi:hypothetical protein